MTRPRHLDPDRRSLRRSLAVAVLKALAALAAVSVAVAVMLLLTSPDGFPSLPPDDPRPSPAASRATAALAPAFG